jgi:hypothetical protein
VYQVPSVSSDVSGIIMIFSFIALVAFAISSSIAIADAEPTVFEIGNDRPEGIHILPDRAAEGIFPGAPVAIISRVVYGGVTAMNLATGETKSVVPSLGFYERNMWGLWYTDGAIFAAGGGPGVGVTAAALHVFDLASGDLIVSCAPADDHVASFLNDVTVLDGIAYLTDSEVNRIMTVDVAEALQGNCVVSSIETPDYFIALEPGHVDFRANGTWPSGLLSQLSHFACCSSLVFAHYFLKSSTAWTQELLLIMAA